MNFHWLCFHQQFFLNKVIKLTLWKQKVKFHWLCFHLQFFLHKIIKLTFFFVGEFPDNGISPVIRVMAKIRIRAIGLFYRHKMSGFSTHTIRCISPMWYFTMARNLWDFHYFVRASECFWWFFRDALIIF